MRIAYVTETYPPELNGVAITVERAVEHLRQRGHDVLLVRPRQPGEAARDDHEEWRTPGLPIPMYPDLRFGLSRVTTLRRRWQAAAPEHVHVATPGPLGRAALVAARKLGIATSADYRTHFQRYSHYYGVGWLERPLAAYLRALHRHADCTFVPTRELAGALRQAGFLGIEVLGRGVDTSRFTPARRSDALRRAWGVGPDDPVSILVGRLAAEKNVTLALRAHAAQRHHLPGARLVVVGDGPLRRTLQRQHPDVIFAGVQRGDALAEHYASADIFLFPSLTDTFGNVTLEAMASGLLVVAFDTAAAREHLHGSPAALLALPGSDQAFVRQALEAAFLLVDEPELAAALRRQTRDAALHVRWSEVLERFEARLAQLVRRAVLLRQADVALA